MIPDGWLYTGDLAVINDEGYVNIVDRKKDMIITCGENVYSTEVENVLYWHPDVLEAAVIGVPDDDRGEAVVACVVLKAGTRVSEEEIISFCRERAAHFKALRAVPGVCRKGRLSGPGSQKTTVMGPLTTRRCLRNGAFGR